MSARSRAVSSSRSGSATPPELPGRPPWWRRSRMIVGILALAAAVALLSVAVVGLVNSGDGTGTDDSAAATSDQGPVYPELAALARRHQADPMARGRADAPVVLIEYSDFQCPFCKQFARDTEPELIEEYVRAGVLRIEWRNMPVFGPESETAAAAGWAAAQQGKFWEFHDALYTNAPDRKNSGVFTEDHLAELAAGAGVADIARFRADLASPAAAQAVQTDLTEGLRIGVNSTPAFLINGRPMLGAQPITQFRAYVDAAARAARSTK